MQSRSKAEAPCEEGGLDPSADWQGEERRRDDRRHRPTHPWHGLFSPMRRASGRRDEDTQVYVDRYTGQDVALLLAIFLLNVADAFFTMMWLSRGGKEANPVMDFFLDIGPAAFLAQKCLVVGFWLVLLVVHKNFRFARIGLYATLLVYSLLLIVHFGIIAFGVEPPSDEDVAQSKIIRERMTDARHERDRATRWTTGSWSPDPVGTTFSRRVDPPASE